MNVLRTHALALALMAPAVMSSPSPLSSNEIASIRANADPALAAMRAGRVDVSASFRVDERAELQRAQSQSPSLAALRGGITDEQLTWLILGGAIVLLIVLL